MSKVICDVCGTSYPETATQCPICGCVRPADAPTVPEESAAAAASGTYQHVKGGRFSKANVRKRNASAAAAAQVSSSGAKKSGKNKSSQKKNSNLGLVITIIVLLLAIIAVIGYIFVKFFLPAAPAEDVSSDTVNTGIVDATPPTAEPEIYCESVELDKTELILNEIGAQYALGAVVTPADTTDVLEWSSDTETVATVDEGLVTAVDFGQAVITVKCGEFSAQCTVIVEEAFALDAETVTLDAAGAAISIYSGTLDLSAIEWTSDDPSVAVIADGVITAVGSGSTTVSGEYRGTLLTCAVSCNFDVPVETTEATDTDVALGPYTLKNLTGISNSDVSLNVGESFQLALLDANGDKINDATWTVKGSCCTVNNGTVKALSSGTVTVIVSYNGETFECTVRVR